MLKNKLFPLYIIFCFIFCSYPHCDEQDSKSEQKVEKVQIKVVGSNRPVVGLLAMLLDGITEPELLNSSQSSSHHMMLSPRQYNVLSQADFFVWVGKDYEYSLAKVVEKIFIEPSSEMSERFGDIKQFALQQTPTLNLLPKRRGGLFPGCAHDHEAGEDHHSHSNVDAHFFISIPHAKDCCVHLTALMLKKWPHLDQKLKENLYRTLKNLDELEINIRFILEPVKNKSAFSDHDSLQYWEKAYGFDIRGVMSNDEGVAPSIKHVKNLDAELNLNRQEKALKCFFYAGFSNTPEQSQPPSLMKKLCEPFDLPLFPFDYEGQNSNLSQIKKTEWYSAILKRLALDLASGFVNSNHV